MAAISIVSGFAATLCWLLSFMFIFMYDDCPREGYSTISILAGLVALGFTIYFIGYTF